MKTIYIILIVLCLVIWAARYFYKRRLTKLRDNSNFNTVRGKATIKACNEKLDRINGYGIFKRRANS